MQVMYVLGIFGRPCMRDTVTKLTSSFLLSFFDWVRLAISSSTWSASREKEGRVTTCTHSRRGAGIGEADQWKPTVEEIMAGGALRRGCSSCRSDTGPVGRQSLST